MIWLQCGVGDEVKRQVTFPPHSYFEAFLQPTILTLVAMVLINRTGSACSTSVAKVPSDAPFEKAFTSLTCVLSVVLPTRFVRTHNALYLLRFVVHRIIRRLARNRLRRIA